MNSYWCIQINQSLIEKHISKHETPNIDSVLFTVYNSVLSFFDDFAEPLSIICIAFDSF